LFYKYVLALLMTFAIAHPFFKNLSRTFLYGRRIHASAFQAQASAGAAAAVAAAPLPNIEIERPRGELPSLLFIITFV